MVALPPLPKDWKSSGAPSAELALMLSIVLLAADVPEVRVHGLLAVRLILLRLEGDLILRDRHQVALTSLHSRTNCGEASASVELIGGHRSGTVVLAYHVDTGADGVGRRCYTVGSQQCAGVITVRRALFRSLGQKAGYELNTLGPFYFCHSE